MQKQKHERGQLSSYYTSDDVEETLEGLQVIEKLKKIEFSSRNKPKYKYDAHHCRALIKAEAVKRGWIKPEDNIFLRVVIHDKGVVGSATWMHNEQKTHDELVYAESPSWRR